MTKVVLGGIMGPIVPAAVTTAVEYPSGYLRARISGMIIPPIAATVATADPLMLAKIMQAMIAANARPPR